MSVLNWVTSIFGLVKFPGGGVPREECNPTTLDDRGNGEHYNWNDDHRGREDYFKHNGGWNDAKNDDCQQQNDYYEPKPSDSCGTGETYRNPGEALAKFDFSHGDFVSHGAGHSGDMQVALASMSSGDALEYAIGQMGPADHLDMGHLDVAAETSHDTDA